MEQNAMRSYVDGINQNAPEKIGALFAADGYFSDGAGRLLGSPDGNGTGPAEITAVFQGIMSQFKMKAVILRMNQRSMEYDVYLGDEIILPCVGTVTVNERGEITEYMARPR